MSLTLYQLNKTRRNFDSIFLSMACSLSQKVHQRLFPLEKKRRYGVPVWFLLCSRTCNLHNHHSFCILRPDHFTDRFPLFRIPTPHRLLQPTDSKPKRNRFIKTNVPKDPPHSSIRYPASLGVSDLIFLDQ